MASMEVASFSDHHGASYTGMSEALPQTQAGIDFQNPLIHPEIYPREALNLTKRRLISEIAFCHRNLFIQVYQKIAAIFSKTYQQDLEAAQSYEEGLEEENLTINSFTDLINSASERTKWKYFLERGKLYLLNQEFQKAYDDFSEVLKHCKTVEILYLCALALHGLEDYLAAQTFFRQVCEFKYSKTTEVFQKSARHEVTLLTQDIIQNGKREDPLGFFVNYSIEDLEIMSTYDEGYEEQLRFKYLLKANNGETTPTDYDALVRKVRDLKFSKPPINIDFAEVEINQRPILNLSKVRLITQIRHPEISRLFQRIMAILFESYRKDLEARTIYQETEDKTNIQTLTNLIEIASERTQWQYYLERGKCYLLAGQFQEAYDDFCKISPHLENTEILYLKALTSHGLENYLEAYQLFEKICKQKPTKDIEVFQKSASNEMILLVQDIIQKAKDYPLSLEELEIACEYDEESFGSALMEAYFVKALEQTEAKSYNFYMTKAANQKFAEQSSFTQYALYYCHNFGIGLRRNTTQALKWLEKSARSDLAAAQFDWACHLIAKYLEEMDTNQKGLILDEAQKLLQKVNDSNTVSTMLKSLANGWLAELAMIHGAHKWREKLSQWKQGPYQLSFEEEQNSLKKERKRGNLLRRSTYNSLGSSAKS